MVEIWLENKLTILLNDFKLTKFANKANLILLLFDMTENDKKKYLNIYRQKLW